MTTPMSTSWHSYPKIWALGHAAISDLLKDEVLVEEKIDGSQFSFGRFGDEIKIRSKGKEMFIDEPEKMFSLAAHTVKMLAPFLKDGWTYRAEYLQKPKHNVLAYGRTPNQHLILFDINTGEEAYLTYEEKKAEADRLGLETVPILYRGLVTDVKQMVAFLERESCLGCAKIEGFVVKNYSRFGVDKKVLMGKYVSETFKEKHGKEWKASNPGKQEIVALLTQRLTTEARWQKALQHLGEAGALQSAPQDIPALMREVKQDVKQECAEEIRNALFEWAWPQIERGIIRGLPEWYKTHLLELSVENS